jgi:hypothetical protein
MVDEDGTRRIYVLEAGFIKLEAKVDVVEGDTKSIVHASYLIPSTP